MTHDAAMAHLDTYLVQMRRRLHALPSGEVEEILKELRSHVLDRVEGALTPNGVETALAALGSPAEIARANVTQRAAAMFDTSPAPVRLLRALWRVASVSVLGVFVFLVSLIGYAMSAGFLGMAVLKPFLPGSVGLWQSPSSDGTFQYAFGTIDRTVGARELLGWWSIPVALIAGLVIGYLTWRLGAGALRLMAQGRRQRRPVEFA